jgi:hypothetical protein
MLFRAWMYCIYASMSHVCVCMLHLNFKEKHKNKYRLLLLGGVEQSIPSAVAIFWHIVHPCLSADTPDSSSSALWLHQRHLAVMQGGGEKCTWILLA